MDLDNKPFQQFRVMYLDKLKNFDILDNNKIDSEGLLIQFEDNSFIKLQTNYFKNELLFKPNYVNKYKSLLKLYQDDLLIEHLNRYPSNKKICNPKFTNEIYDILGVIDASFKMLITELYELFKLY